jgi:hypothetical protein
MMQIDLQSSFLVGSAMAAISRDRLVSRPAEGLARGRTLALVFGALIFTPIWIYITVRWTGWESMYTWDWTTVPRIVLTLFPPGLSIAAVAGFSITAALLASGRQRIAAVINAAMLGSCLVIILLRWDRFTFVGTKTEFLSGERGNLFHSDLLRFVVWASILFFAPAAFILFRQLRRSG